MYCPECGVDFRPGFTHCSDCHVLLVHQRPRRTRDRVTVMEGSDPQVIASAKDFLAESGVPSHIWHEEGDGPVVPSIYHPCGLEVAVDLEVEARALLELMETGNPEEDGYEEQGPPPDPNLELATVLEHSDPLILAAAKSALKEAGIPFYVYGEERGVYLEIGRLLNAWCRIEVAADRQAEARELLLSLERQIDAAGEEGHGWLP